MTRSVACPTPAATRAVMAELRHNGIRFGRLRRRGEVATQGLLNDLGELVGRRVKTPDRTTFYLWDDPLGLEIVCPTRDAVDELITSTRGPLVLPTFCDD